MILLSQKECRLVPLRLVIELHLIASLVLLITRMKRLVQVAYQMEKEEQFLFFSSQSSLSLPPNSKIVLFKMYTMLLPSLSAGFAPLHPITHKPETTMVLAHKYQLMKKITILLLIAITAASCQKGIRLSASLRDLNSDSLVIHNSDFKITLQGSEEILQRSSTLPQLLPAF